MAPRSVGCHFVRRQLDNVLLLTMLRLNDGDGNKLINAVEGGRGAIQVLTTN